MPVSKTRAEVELLQRVDDLYRDGETQEQIAVQVGLTSSGALHSAVNRLGFRFERKGGLKLVDAMFNRPLADWIATGDLVAADDSATAPATVAA